MSYIECDHLRYRITWSLATLNPLWNKMGQKWILKFFEFEVNFRRSETPRVTAAVSMLTTISSPSHWLALLGWTKSFAFTENLNYQPWTSCIRQIPVKTAEYLNSGSLPQTLWSFLPGAQAVTSCSPGGGQLSIFAFQELGASLPGRCMSWWSHLKCTNTPHMFSRQRQKLKLRWPHRLW